jgi:hypothetical protein
MKQNSNKITKNKYIGIQLYIIYNANNTVVKIMQRIINSSL